MKEQMEKELKKQIYFGHEAKKEYDKKLEQLKKEQKEKLAEQIKKRDAGNI